jgi:hypothetical protein
MHRYVDVSDFRAPYDSPQLDMAGVGDGAYPTAHRYFDVSNFRAPYDHRSYYQDNTLFGVGATVLDRVQSAVCPVKDPIRNPYTLLAALLGAVVGGAAGFVVARVMR